MNAFLARSCFEPEHISFAVNDLSSQVGHGKAQESGEQDSAGARGAGRRRKQRPECRLLFVVTAGWRAGDDSQGGGLGPGRYPLRGLPKLLGTEVGLAQVSDPSDPPPPHPPRLSPRRGGETREGWEGL